MNLFVISDKQGSGKTFIISGIAATMQSLGYSVGYYKPVQTGAIKQSGFLHSDDVTYIKKIDPNLNTSVSYVFETSALPILAAKNENTEIQPQVILKDFLTLRKKSDIVLIEGYSGLVTPISENIDTIDLIKAMQASLLIVVEPSRDVLEKTLLLIHYARHAGLKICGVILNKFLVSNDLNTKNLASMIEMYSEVPVVGIVKYQTDIAPSELIDNTLHTIDIETIFGMSIPKLNNYTE